MRKAINAALGGDLIRGSWWGLQPPRALCFRYASARGGPGVEVSQPDGIVHVRNVARGGCGTGGYFRPNEQTVGCPSESAAGTMWWLARASCCRGEPPAA